MILVGNYIPFKSYWVIIKNPAQAKHGSCDQDRWKKASNSISTSHFCDPNKESHDSRDRFWDIYIYIWNDYKFC
jgi:hypothetical protein